MVKDVNFKQWNATYFISSKAPWTASRMLLLDCWRNAAMSTDDSLVGIDIFTIVLPNAYRRLLMVDRLLQVWQHLQSSSNNVAANRFLQRRHSGSAWQMWHSSCSLSVGMRQSETSSDRLHIEMLMSDKIADLRKHRYNNIKINNNNTKPCLLLHCMRCLFDDVGDGARARFPEPEKELRKLRNRKSYC